MKTFRQKRRLTPLLFACLLCLLPGGCGTDLAGEDFAKVEDGMTHSEVEAILGPGHEITWEDVQPIAKPFGLEGLNVESCDTWFRWGSRKTFGIVGFKDGQACQRIFKGGQAP